MTIDQALGILRPEPRTIEGLKTAYRAYMLKYHPDINPNGLELCKLGNAANDFLIKNAHVWAKNDFQPDENTDPEYNIAEEIDAIYRKINHFAGLRITLSGVWLWVDGDTYRYKEELKKVGFTWASKKKAWSWKPADAKRRNHKEEWTFDKIFTKYGKVDLDLRNAEKLTTA